MCDSACHQWNPPVKQSETGFTTFFPLVIAPPQVCTGTYWSPGTLTTFFRSGEKHKCGICGQYVEIDAYGRLVLHPYIKVG